MSSAARLSVDLVPQYPNLMVLRTFSKWAGLAGLRIGYGVFTPKMADILLKIKPPYNVNMAASWLPGNRLRTPNIFWVRSGK